MINYTTIIAVASGGAIGAVLRLLVNAFITKHIPHTLPFGTLVVNLIGSFIIGVLFAYFHHTPHISPYLKSFLITGILGALTTYSTFAMESFFLLRYEEYFYAFANMFLNLAGTITFAGVGYLAILHFLKQG